MTAENSSVFICLTTLAGTPATTVRAGTSLVTTAPVAICHNNYTTNKKNIIST